MEKNGTNIDEDIKYFSWSEEASIILRLRKEMINEEMQGADELIIQNEEVIEIYEEYEILFYEENFRNYHNMEFSISMNQYMLHSQFIEKERSVKYEDRFVPILERMLEQN
jgi:S-adenosylmethionine synthetase